MSHTHSGATEEVNSYLALTVVFLVFIDMQDRWDSIQNNEYFSIEGAKDVIRQVSSTTSLGDMLCSLFASLCFNVLSISHVTSLNPLPVLVHIFHTSIPA